MLLRASSLIKRDAGPQASREGGGRHHGSSARSPPTRGRDQRRRSTMRRSPSGLPRRLGRRLYNRQRRRNARLSRGQTRPMRTPSGASARKTRGSPTSSWRLSCGTRRRGKLRRSWRGAHASARSIRRKRRPRAPRAPRCCRRPPLRGCGAPSSRASLRARQSSTPCSSRCRAAFPSAHTYRIPLTRGLPHPVQIAGTLSLEWQRTVIAPLLVLEPGASLSPAR